MTIRASEEMRMRGTHSEQSSMFSYISAERRVPTDHPLRAIRVMADMALKDLDQRFAGMYATLGRPSIAPERLLRALDRKSTRLNSSHVAISYAVFCLKKKKNHRRCGHLSYTI